MDSGNLRIIRFETLVTDLREALRSIGVEGQADFPWVNRSQRDPYPVYYTPRAEEAVYQRYRWAFDTGFYPRFEPDQRPSCSSMARTAWYLARPLLPVAETGDATFTRIGNHECVIGEIQQPKRRSRLPRKRQVRTRESMVVERQDPPNIVLIMTDQQRADFSQAEGFPFDTTPFLDALRGAGHAVSPCVCLHAGLHAIADQPLHGPLSQGHPRPPEQRREHLVAPTDLIQVLREQGYACHLTGKNHTYLRGRTLTRSRSTSTRAPRPIKNRPMSGEWTRGWQSSIMGSIPSPPRSRWTVSPPSVSSMTRSPASIGRDARPFFLWLSFPEPHNPYQVPEPYFSLFPEDAFPERIAGPEAAREKGGAWWWLRQLIERKRTGYDGRWRRYRANYCGMLRLIDDQIRRFVDHLEAEGIRDNTLLIFLADHGDYAGDYGLQRKGVGMPSASVRVPLIMAGSGITTHPSARTDFVSLVDLFPTLCEMLGVEIPFGVQGRSLWPMLTGGDYPAEEFRSIYAESGFGGLPYTADDDPPLHFPADGQSFDELNSFTQSGNTKMVRMGSWKLLYDVLGRGELYDLSRDPAELHNRFDDPVVSQVRMQMVEELLTWTIRTEDDLPHAQYIPKRVAHNWHAPYREDLARAGSATPRPRPVPEPAMS